VRLQHVTACLSIANILKSSLGPVGLDKMIVDDLGEVTVTNDGATILKLLEVQQPAAKILVELADLQDNKVGDGTTSTVIFCADLLRKSSELVRRKIHPTSIITGFRLAMRQACKYIDTTLAIPAELFGNESLFQCAKTSMSSKSVQTESDFFAQMVVDAVSAIKAVDFHNGKIKCPIKSIGFLKVLGQSVRGSCLLPGYAMNAARVMQAMPSVVMNAKIACLDFDVRKIRIQMGVQVLVNDPCDLERICESESEITEERIKKILKAGANVVITTKGIDDLAMKYFVEAKTIACRRVGRVDMRHIAHATCAEVVSTLADMGGNETFYATALGNAELVYEEAVANKEIIMFKITVKENVR